jgi:hypothetical protein
MIRASPSPVSSPVLVPFSGLFVHRLQDGEEAPSVGVLEVEDLRQRPVEAGGNVRDLVEQVPGRVRQDSPGAPPATSTVKAWSQDGQVTAAWVCPSWLIRR